MVFALTPVSGLAGLNVTGRPLELVAEGVVMGPGFGATGTTGELAFAR